MPPIRSVSREEVPNEASLFPEVLKSWLSMRLCCSADIAKAESQVFAASSTLADSRLSSLEEGEIREENAPAKAPTTPSTAPPTGTRRSKSSSSLGSNDPMPLAEDLQDHQRTAAEIQKKMRKFVKAMVHGVESSVLSIDGQLRTCTLSLDRKLRFFAIEVVRRVRKIPLASIKEVQQGLEPEDIETPLDHLCATLILATDECISFRFSTVSERQDFALCLSVLLDGQ